MNNSVFDSVYELFDAALSEANKFKYGSAEYEFHMGRARAFREVLTLGAVKSGGAAYV